jgi:RHS repeat-associated protein
MTSRDGSAIAWTSFNLPSQIAQGSNTAQFFYAADRSRYKQISVTASGGSLPAGTETTLSIGGIFEKVTKPSGVVEYRHAIVAGKEVIALRTLRSSGANDTRYLIKDHLGSVDTVADEAGAVTMRLSFDAFGKRRNAASWSGTPSASDWTQIAATTHRGFTFHEMLDNVGLVHMSGRVYDPLIGRFLSADPNIPDASNSQMLNRYSYVDNNPLSYTDPSGFFLKKLFKKVKSFVKQWGGTIISIGFAMVGMPFVGALLSSAFNTAVNGGSVGSFLKNFAIGAAAGYVTGPIAGRLTSGLGLNASLVSTQVVRGGLGGGLSGGLSSTVSGGGFWEGFKGGAISGGVTAGVVGLYWQHTTEQFIKNNVTCTGGCSQSMLQTIREGGMSAVGQRLMSGFRSSGAMLTISPESSSPAGVGIGPHVITGTNDMYFDGNVQSRLGNLLAGEPWGPSLNDATTFVHELGHTVAGFNVQDPLNVSVSENLYRSWMGTPARSDYALLAQGQTSDPVPSRSIVDRIWRPW